MLLLLIHTEAHANITHAHTHEWSGPPTPAYELIRADQNKPVSFSLAFPCVPGVGCSGPSAFDHLTAQPAELRQCCTFRATSNPCVSVGEHRQMQVQRANVSSNQTPFIPLTHKVKHTCASRRRNSSIVSNAEAAQSSAAKSQGRANYSHT
jgi:hypothetical protein